MTALSTESEVELDDRRHRRRIAVIALLLLLAVTTPFWLWWRASRTTAAFADAEVLETNRLGAATLDLEIGPRTVLFDARNLAPGDTVTGHLELVNVGTLPLAFVVSATGDGDPLAEWLRFDVWTTDTICRPDQPGRLLASDLSLTSTSAILVGEYTATGLGPESKLGVGESTVVCLGAELLLSAPNSVQGRNSEVDLIVDAFHDLEAQQ